MSKKINGSGNGHDKESDNIVRMPTLAERDRARKEQARLEKKAQKAAEPPFLNLSKITPFVRALVLAFLVVHIPVYLLFSDAQKLQAIYAMGFIPGALTGPFEFNWYTPLTPITHLFIHGSWMHLVFNTVMTLALGIFFEREFGTRTTAIFFFACGLLGALCYFVLNPFSIVPVIGASGGISGFFGAVLILLQQRNQLGAFNKRGPWPMIAFWLIFMVVVGFLSGENMAWQAHVGGFLAGVLLLRGLQKGIVKF